jgi:hypothetical protein
MPTFRKRDEEFVQTSFIQVYVLESSMHNEVDNAFLDLNGSAKGASLNRTIFSAYCWGNGYQQKTMVAAKAQEIPDGH